MAAVFTRAHSAVLQDPDGYYAKCEEEQSALRQKLVDATRRLKSVQMDPDVSNTLRLSAPPVV